MMERGYLVSGRYQIIDTLGEGGMANVYLAEDTFLHRQVAVKVLRMDLQHDQATIRRFQREAKATCELSHPNIVSVYDVGSDDGMQYIVMEYVQGEDLKAFIERHFPMPLSEVLDMMDQILSAMQLAHSQGIIHRDLKPQNILVTPTGQVKIADFGIAVALNDQSATQTNSLLGSVHYISPEQARGGMATPRSDIYALGIILYELLTGKVPFAGDSAVTIALKHFHEEIPSMRALNDAIPQPLENVVLKATAKDPAQRYQSAAAMAQDLKTSLDPERANEPKFVATTVDQDLAATKVLADLPAAVSTSELAGQNQASVAEAKTATTATPEVKPKKKRKWLPWAIGGGVVLLAGVIFALVLLFGKRDVVVPDLAGMSQSEATSALADHDLKVGELVYENSTAIAKDLVIRSIPGKSSSVKADSQVRLVLSKGAKTYRISDYADLEYNEVKEKLTKAGLTVKRKSKSSDSIAAGRIIKQSIASGKRVVAKETTITLTVSSGEPTFALRDLTSYSKKSVQDYAEDKDIKVNFVEAYSESVDSGSVISTDPTAGTMITTGTTITVTMSKGADPAQAERSFSKTIAIPFVGSGDTSSSDASSDDANDNSAGSSSSSVATTGNKIVIYIGDADHSIESIYKTLTITQDTNVTLNFTVKGDNAAEYRITRDGELFDSGSVTP